MALWCTMGFHQFLHENVHPEEVFMGFHEMDLQHGLESCIFAIQFAGALGPSDWSNPVDHWIRIFQTEYHEYHHHATVQLFNWLITAWVASKCQGVARHRDQREPHLFVTSGFCSAACFPVHLCTSWCFAASPLPLWQCRVGGVGAGPTSNRQPVNWNVCCRISPFFACFMSILFLSQPFGGFPYLCTTALFRGFRSSCGKTFCCCWLGRRIWPWKSNIRAFSIHASSLLEQKTHQALRISWHGLSKLSWIPMYKQTLARTHSVMEYWPFT